MSLDKLLEFRSEIDKIDSEIIELLKRRMNVVSNVATYKKTNNIEIQNVNREDVILNSITEKAGELSPYIQEVYRVIMGQSREYQLYLQKEV